MNLDELADELIEIRRYVRSHPEHVREQLTKSVPQAHVVETPFADRFARLAENIHAGLDRILCDPEILEGYLYGAAAEIRELASREVSGVSGVASTRKRYVIDAYLMIRGVQHNAVFVMAAEAWDAMSRDDQREAVKDAVARRMRMIADSWGYTVSGFGMKP